MTDTRTKDTSMKAATHRNRRQELIAVDRDGPGMHLASAGQLSEFFVSGDLLIVNDAATLPASLPARNAGGEAFEIRLARREGPRRWQVVLMGAGSWRDDTNARPAPPQLHAGERLCLARDLGATLEELDPAHSRLGLVRFDLEDPQLLSALYRQAAPVQYSYHDRALPLSWLQSPFAGRPWSVEMPSAGRALTWQNLSALRKREVVIARLTHSAGLSATGSPELDALLPLPERYDIPQATVAAIEAAQRRGSRIIAVGTTVVRALEGCMAERGAVMAGEAETRLRLSEAHRLQVVDGILSGLHASGESHFELLSAFAGKERLQAAWQRAQEAGLQNHELGDAMLLVPDLTRHKTVRKPAFTRWRASFAASFSALARAPSVPACRLCP